MFLAKTPALQRLKQAISNKLKGQVAKKIKQHLLGLDKRRLGIRSDHAALNTLLQSAGAIIMKKATVLAYRYLHAEGFLFGRDWALCAHIHDEMQIEARAEIAERVGQIVVQAMVDAGLFFNLKLPIAGEYKIGFTWADTH